MATRLRDLNVTKVDFVDAGDNKKAHVLLFKHAESNNQEGVLDMKIDKSKLSEEEVAMLEAIEKKAGIPDDTPDMVEDRVSGQESTVRSAAAVVVEPVSGFVSPSVPPAIDSNEDLFKGLHPAVKKQLEAQMRRLEEQEERLKKQADAYEERELLEIAKKYEITGQRPEELVPLLKSLKAAGGNAYDQMISVLDASVQAWEKSGLFREIGKRGLARTPSGDAWSQIEKHAAKIREANPNLNYNVSIDKACELHPDLLQEYEAERNV